MGHEIWANFLTFWVSQGVPFFVKARKLDSNRVVYKFKTTLNYQSFRVCIYHLGDVPIVSEAETFNLGIIFITNVTRNAKFLGIFDKIKISLFAKYVPQKLCISCE